MSHTTPSYQNGLMFRRHFGLAGKYINLKPKPIQMQIVMKIIRLHHLWFQKYQSNLYGSFVITGT
jgi:hypothetical protein